MHNFIVRRASIALSLACVLALGCGSNDEADAALDAEALAAVAPHPSAPVCAPAQPGFATCHALLRTGESADAAKTKPDGLGASDLASAYDLPKSGGEGVTVAIVDAHDDPTAEADLAVYRKQYGLPACTLASGCLRIVNQSGTSTLPSTQAGRRRSRSIWRWSARPALPARSSSSKRARSRWPISAPPRTPRSSWARRW
jgi:hypothetical protein